MPPTPKDDQVLIPRTCEYVTSHSKRTLQIWLNEEPWSRKIILDYSVSLYKYWVVGKVMTFFLCFSIQKCIMTFPTTQWVTFPSCGQKNSQRDAMLLALKMNGGSHKPRNVGSLQLLEKARKHYLPEPPESNG